jgi:hypothetical protein
MAVSLTTLLPPSRSGRTFLAASALLGAFALIQLSLLGWYLTRVRKAVPIARSGDFAPASTPALELPFRVGSSMQPPPAVALQPLDTPGIDQPKPAPAARTPLAELVEQARVFRQNGDANNALAKLREAQAMEPDNPQVMAEMGITYEIMQLQDRAFEQWQHLYNLGDSVGALYYLADAKLHATSPAVAPASGAGALTNAGEQPDVPVRDPGGFHDSTMLKITGIHADDDADPGAGKKVSLKIVVKARPGTVIDPKKVNILTYFYDLLDGKVVQTNAQTGFAWLTPPVDWANDESEVLETTYFRAKEAEAAAATPAPATPAPTESPKEGRHRRGKTHAADTPAPPAPTPAPAARTYYGYTVRLYYDRELQDVQADPLRLLQQFPPPLTLSDN